MFLQLFDDSNQLLFHCSNTLFGHTKILVKQKALDPPGRKAGSRDPRTRAGWSYAPHQNSEILGTHRTSTEKFLKNSDRNAPGPIKTAKYRTNSNPSVRGSLAGSVRKCTNVSGRKSGNTYFDIRSIWWSNWIVILQNVFLWNVQIIKCKSPGYSPETLIRVILLWFYILHFFVIF